MPKKVAIATKPKMQETIILRRIVEITNSDLNLDLVLNEVVEIVSEFTRADSIFIYLFDRTKKNLILKASKTSHKVDLGTINLKVGEGLTGWVAKELKPVSLEKNAFKDSRFKAFSELPEDTFEAFLGVPIVYKNNAIGVINVQHQSPQAYPKSLIELFATVATLVAGVIEHARLYKETKLKALQFESFMKVSQSITSEKYLDDILESIVQVSAEMLDSKICSIMLLDEKGQNLLLKATQSLSQAYKSKPNIQVSNSLSGDVIQRKKPLSVLDVTKEKKYLFRDLAEKEGLSSMLLVPMIVKDQAIGLVNVYTKVEHEFTNEEISALQIISNQAASAIENARLAQESEEAKEALQTRKVVERAKGLLMKTNNVTEDAAYKIIRRKSMDSCRSMKEIAEAIILTADLS